jgi:hypothetical protein
MRDEPHRGGERNSAVSGIRHGAQLSVSDVAVQALDLGDTEFVSLIFGSPLLRPAVWIGRVLAESLRVRTRRCRSEQIPNAAARRSSIASAATWARSAKPQH